MVQLVLCHGRTQDTPAAQPQPTPRKNGRLVDASTLFTNVEGLARTIRIDSVGRAEPDLNCSGSAGSEAGFPERRGKHPLLVTRFQGEFSGLTA